MYLGKANKAVAILKVSIPLHESPCAARRSPRVLSQGSTNPNCLFLLATAYLQLSKLKEAEAALKDDKKQLHASLRDNAAAHHLLGQIYRVREHLWDLVNACYRSAHTSPSFL